MKHIQDFVNISTVIPDWKPTDVAYIKEFSLTTEGYGHTNKITMACLSLQRDRNTHWPDNTKDCWKLTMTFTDVRSLRLDYRGGLLQVTGFDIIDLSDDQTENVNFKVEDYEGGAIGFFCREITIDAVAPYNLNE